MADETMTHPTDANKEPAAPARVGEETNEEVIERIERATADTNSLPQVPSRERLQALLTAATERETLLKEALEKIEATDCPKYVAHPQSVWWSIHVVDIAREALRQWRAKGGGK